MDYSKITDVVMAGVDPKDYPDFCDAFVESAKYDGREMTEAELNSLDSGFVNQKAHEAFCDKRAL